MKSARGHNSGYSDDGYDATDWDDFGPDTNVANPRNDRYSNAYGEYRGGYGPMNNGSGGRGYRQMNNVGYGPMNLISYPLPHLMGPRHFGPGPRPWFNQDNHVMGRGYGPRGPLRQRRNNDKTIKFLQRCGVPKENLRNLPKSMLQLISEENCGLCGQTFNAFAMARIHYVSKNHYKNQKKWLTQHSEGGLQANNEVPFKARELYCEICDVHITSKAHADSHYAGKPHRAIVDGRKMPRNPTLLQENMSIRLEQLIRREKKNLKPIEEDIGNDEEPVKDSKLMQPELYCPICKTSVTCTEQMTMHLNGKRHLSKEKLHILRMMKGESKNGKEKNNESGAEGDKDEGDDDNADDADDDGEEGNKVDGEKQVGGGEKQRGGDKKQGGGDGKQGGDDEMQGDDNEKEDGNEKEGDGDEKQGDGHEKQGDGHEKQGDDQEKQLDGDEKQGDGHEKEGGGHEKEGDGHEKERDGDEKQDCQKNEDCDWENGGGDWDEAEMHW